MEEFLKAYLLDVSFLNDSKIYDEIYNSLDSLSKIKVDKYLFSDHKFLALGEEYLLSLAFKEFDKEYSLKDIIYNEYGKPYLKDNEFYFNLSHSSNYVLVVVSSSEVGCDIQKIKEVNTNVVNRFYSYEENRLIEKSSDKDYHYSMIWSMKESYRKYIGKGIDFDLKDDEYSNYLDKDNFIKDDLKYYVQSIDNYVLCLTYNKFIKNIIIREIKY